MRNKFNIFIIACLLILSSCYDEAHRDFEYSATYFPMKYPSRALIVEEGEPLKFEVGAVVAGLRPENIGSQTIEFAIDPTLLDEHAVDYPNIKLLPESYYTLSNSSQFNIKKAEGTSWVVEVELDKELFLNDPDALNEVYAIPFRITNTSTDQILEDMDYTIVVVRFYNQYHGDYWLRGVDRKLDFNGNVIEEAIYRNDDAVVMGKEKTLVTAGPDKVLLDYIGINDDPNGNYAMNLVVRESDGNAEIFNDSSSDITVLPGGAEYDKMEKAFYLKYSYEDENFYTHEVYDSLYYINIKMQVETWRD